MEVILDKIVFSNSEKYDKLFFFTAFAKNSNGQEIRLQGLSTPELNKVLLMSRVYDPLQKLYSDQQLKLSLIA